MMFYLLTLILQRGSVKFAGNGYDFKMVCSFLSLIVAASDLIDKNTVEKLLINYILPLERNLWSMNEVWNHVVSGEKKIKQHL